MSGSEFLSDDERTLLVLSQRQLLRWVEIAYNVGGQWVYAIVQPNRMQLLKARILRGQYLGPYETEFFTEEELAEHFPEVVMKLMEPEDA